MIFDWDLWPWRIAAGAGDVALSIYRMERAVRRVGVVIGERLLPVLRALGASTMDASRAFYGLADSSRDAP